ncbi:FAD-dependent oxidoreductase [Hymenobacter psoromatis]|uniref:FAD-dependent oxidoreductase n=1 Tax=Hymenobacter psoromatis TaxID=1484116 RepID=UPI001CBC4AD0|nr:FAD-dependent oxidoreductase [Hymenobacter psoromatis]
MSKLPDAPVALVPETNPILIVGAGPTGLTAALELSRLGVPVRLIEQRTEPATTSRALAVQARTLELLAPRGVAAPMLALGNRAWAATIYDSEKQLAQVNLRDIPSRYNFILLLAQSETERLLREQVARQGVAVEWGTELVALAQTEAGVRAVLRGPGGQLEELAAAYLLSAEGAHSLVRHTLGLAFPGTSLPQHYALADLHLDGDLPDDELSIFLAEHGLVAVFPMSDRRFRLIATDPEVTSTAPPTLPELQRLYDAGACHPARLRDLVWSSRFHINSRMVDQLRVGRVLLGGDAAHLHSPAGGQGMNTGIQDMVNLGWKLALVWHGQAPAALLDTYAQDRLPVIRGVVNTTEKATDAFNSTNPLVHTLLTHALPLLLSSSFVQHKGAAVLSQVAADYRASALSQTFHAGGQLRGGDRLPDPDVQPTAASGSVPLYSLLSPSRLTLLCVGPAPLPASWLAQLQPWQPWLAVQIIAAAAEDAGPFTDAFGRGPALVLVRPDAYAAVVARADAAGRAAVLAWLQRWLPRPAGA